MALFGGGGKSKGGAGRSGRTETPKIGLTSGTGSHKYWKKYKNALGKWIYIYKKPNSGVTTSPTQVASSSQNTSPVSTRPVPKPGTVEAKIDAGSQAVAASMQAAGVKPSNRPNAREKTISEGTANVKRGEKVDTKNPLSDQGTVDANTHSTASLNNKNKSDAKSSEVSSAGVPKDENGNLDFSQFHREVEKADVEKAENSESKKSSGGGSSSSGSTSNQKQQIQQTQQNNSSGTENATLAEESEESKKLKETYSKFAELINKGSLTLNDLPKNIQNDVAKLLNSGESTKLKEAYTGFAELVKKGTLKLEDLPEGAREEVNKLISSSSNESSGVGEARKVSDSEQSDLKSLETKYKDYIDQIERGKISIDDIPKSVRSDVQKVLSAHAKEKGPKLDKPLSEIDRKSSEIKGAESFVDDLLKKEA